jgi:RNA polymerase sigma-54 factor
MQKLGLSQTLSQKLSPQQIQFIKLLQVPTAELEAQRKNMKRQITKMMK